MNFDELLRNIAHDNDALQEARAEARCVMGVGCGLYGICFADKHGQPDTCRATPEFRKSLDSKPKS